MFSSNDTPPGNLLAPNEMGAIINLDDITHIQCLEDTLGFIRRPSAAVSIGRCVFKINNDIMDNPGDASMV